MTHTKSGFMTPDMKEAIEIASIHTKPACAGFRNKGDMIPGFGITTNDSQLMTHD
jgi:hypothetical protein